jgi:hypothetical protein
MAKEAARREQTQVAQVGELDDLMKQYKGQGVSTAKADNIVPQIKTLQPLSPEVTAGRGRPGDLLVGDTAVPAAEGIWFQPAFHESVWFEFTPREQGGGFVKSHGEVEVDDGGEELPPAGAKRVKGAAWRYRFENGNECVHYRQWSGLLWHAKQPYPYAINFTSSGHTVAKKWNMKAMSSNRLEDGSSRPLWAHVYHVTTEQKRNSKGTWYLPEIGPAVRIDEADGLDVVGSARTAFSVGLDMHEALASRERVVQEPTKDDEAIESEAM